MLRQVTWAISYKNSIYLKIKIKTIFVKEGENPEGSRAKQPVNDKFLFYFSGLGSVCQYISDFRLSAIIIRIKRWGKYTYLSIQCNVYYTRSFGKVNYPFNCQVDADTCQKTIVSVTAVYNDLQTIIWFCHSMYLNHRAWIFHRMALVRMNVWARRHRLFCTKFLPTLAPILKVLNESLKLFTSLFSFLVSNL